MYYLSICKALRVYVFKGNHFPLFPSPLYHFINEPPFSTYISTLLNWYVSIYCFIDVPPSFTELPKKKSIYIYIYTNGHSFSLDNPDRIYVLVNSFKKMYWLSPHHYGRSDIQAWMPNLLLGDIGDVEYFPGQGWLRTYFLLKVSCCIDI